MSGEMNMGEYGRVGRPSEDDTEAMLISRIWGEIDEVRTFSDRLVMDISPYEYFLIVKRSLTAHLMDAKGLSFAAVFANKRYRGHATHSLYLSWEDTTGGPGDLEAQEWKIRNKRMLWSINPGESEVYQVAMINTTMSPLFASKPQRLDRVWDELKSEALGPGGPFEGWFDAEIDQAGNFVFSYHDNGPSEE